MKRSLSVLSLLGASLLLALCTTGPVAAAAWPASTTGTNIGGDLPAGFEPSGIVWDNPSGYLWVVSDEGTIARMQRDGVGTRTWTIQTGLDLEAIAVTGSTFKLYLGEENPPTILEYNTSTTTAAPTYNNKSWQLNLPVSGNSGMEGLTWVPNGHHAYTNSASGGVFFASSQLNGTIYVYDVNLAQGGSTPTLRGSFTPNSQTDISDLYYSADTRTLFVLYDSANLLLEIDPSTTSYTVKASYTLPTSTSGQEGVTLLPQCPGTRTIIYLADDNGSAAHDVFSFNNYPQHCAN